MRITFECPNCNKELSQSDEYVGKKVRCPDCDSVFNVPDPSNDRYGEVQCTCGHRFKSWDSLLAEGVRCPGCGNNVGQEPGDADGEGDVDFSRYEDRRDGEQGDDRALGADRPGGAGRDVVYCRSCGTKNDSTAFRCPECGKKLARGATHGRQKMHIKTWLAESIFVTVCCCGACPVPGIIGIVYAASVNSHMAAGDYDRARKASDNARTAVTVGFVLGFFMYFIIIVSTLG